MLVDVTTVAATPEAAASFSMLLIKMVIVLGFVCTLAVVILKYLVPRIGVAGSARNNQLIQIHAKRNLDPKRHLWVIQVGPRYFLVGSGEGAVTPIAELDSSDLAEEYADA